MILIFKIFNTLVIIYFYFIITKNNRPISLLPIIARLFEKALSSRLLTHCINTNLIQPWNCAFQPNKATDDIVCALSEDIIRNFERGSLTTVGITDIASAYDTVWINGLCYKLINNYNIDGRIIKFLKSYLSNRYNRVTYGDYSTEWEKHDQGLHQGGPAMPIFWTLYINDYKLLTQNIGLIEIVAFADDIGIYIRPSEYNAENIQQLQLELNNLYYYTCKWRLVLNAAKCSTLSLTRKLKLSSRVLTINGTPLECIHHPNNPPDICAHSKCPQHQALLKQYQTSTDINFNPTPNNAHLLNPSQFRMNTNDPHSIPLWVRILGLYFDPKLNWNQHVQHIINRVKHKLYKLQRIAQSPYFHLSPKVVWKLYLSTIRPIIEYGLGIYGGASQFHELELLQRKAARIALRSPRSANYLYNYQVLNVQSLYQRRDTIRAKLWVKLTRAHPSLLSNATFNN